MFSHNAYAMYVGALGAGYCRCYQPLDDGEPAMGKLGQNNKGEYDILALFECSFFILFQKYVSTKELLMIKINTIV